MHALTLHQPAARHANPAYLTVLLPTGSNNLVAHAIEAHASHVREQPDGVLVSFNSRDDAVGFIRTLDLALAQDVSTAQRKAIVFAIHDVKNAATDCYIRGQIGASDLPSITTLAMGDSHRARHANPVYRYDPSGSAEWNLTQAFGSPTGGNADWSSSAWFVAGEGGSVNPDRPDIHAGRYAARSLWVVDMESDDEFCVMLREEDDEGDSVDDDLFCSTDVAAVMARAQEEAKRLFPADGPTRRANPRLPAYTPPYGPWDRITFTKLPVGEHFKFMNGNDANIWEKVSAKQYRGVRAKDSAGDCYEPHQKQTFEFPKTTEVRWLKQPKRKGNPRARLPALPKPQERWIPVDRNTSVLYLTDHHGHSWSVAARRDGRWNFAKRPAAWENDERTYYEGDVTQSLRLAPGEVFDAAKESAEHALKSLLKQIAQEEAHGGGPGVPRSANPVGRKPKKPAESVAFVYRGKTLVGRLARLKKDGTRVVEVDVDADGLNAAGGEEVYFDVHPSQVREQNPTGRKPKKLSAAEVHALARLLSPLLPNERDRSAPDEVFLGDVSSSTWSKLVASGLATDGGSPSTRRATEAGRRAFEASPQFRAKLAQMEGEGHSKREAIHHLTTLPQGGRRGNPTGRYRVASPGTGTILAEGLPSKRAAEAHIAMLADWGSTADLRIQRYVGGSADDPGDWVNVKRENRGGR